MKKVNCRRGDVIFRENDPSDCMYSIHSGMVGIFQHYGEENEMKLTELDEGDFFGEMGLMNQEPRAADAVVLEDGTVLWRIEEKELDEIFSEAPSRVLSVMKGMTKRLRALTAEYLLACQTVAGLADAEPDALSEELRACMERCSGMFWDEPKQA